jgi:hypothetical protein
LIVLPLEGALNQSGQLIRGAIDGLIQGCGLVSDRNGLAPFKAGFQHTTHSVMANLHVTILITQMYFY